MQNTESSFEEKTIEVNGISVSYVDAGSSAVPIIFLHGFPFNKSCWQHQIKSLCGHYRSIALDLRGFGHTSNDTTRLSISLFADDLIAFMDKLQIRKAIVCGVSMGGYILMNALPRYANKFAGIVLSDTQCIADSEEGKNKRMKAADTIEQEGLKNFSENFVTTVFTKETLENNKDLVGKIKEVIQSTPTETVIKTLHALADRSETCTNLKQVNIPALIICGKEDTLTPLSQSEFLFNNINGAELHVIKEAAHLPNLEKPEEFNRLVLAFCDKISSRL